MHISYQSIEDKFPGEGKERYNEIARMVGGEIVGGSFTNHEGGLDLTGVFDKENPAYTDETRIRIKALTEKKAALKTDDPVVTPAIPAANTQKDGNN